MAWLHSLTGFGMKLGLEAVSALLDELDRPCFDRPAVLVAGTNGKGSTAAMTAAILTAWGARTVLFTSPHVASVTERIRIDGRPISQAALIRHLKTIRFASHSRPSPLPLSFTAGTDWWTPLSWRWDSAGGSTRRMFSRPRSG
jgi:folylpolyglutamate synthase/dihydropteroate synthase